MTEPAKLPVLSKSQQPPSPDQATAPVRPPGVGCATDPLLIEVFTAKGCSRCTDIMAMAGRVMEQFDRHIELRLVNVLEEIDRAVALGILMTPAIVINGKLAFSAPPSARKFRATLARHLDHERSGSAHR